MEQQSSSSQEDLREIARIRNDLFQAPGANVLDANEKLMALQDYLMETYTENIYRTLRGPMATREHAQWLAKTLLYATPYFHIYIGSTVEVDSPYIGERLRDLLLELGESDAVRLLEAVERDILRWVRESNSATVADLRQHMNEERARLGTLFEEPETGTEPSAPASE